MKRREFIAGVGSAALWVRVARAPLIADLVRSQVSVIVTDTTNGAADAKAATNTIPIIFLAGADPVEFGLVASFNRPGGNVTSFAVQGIEVTGKRLELLHKLVPEAALIATIVGVPGARVTGDVGLRYMETEARDFQSAARFPSQGSGRFQAGISGRLE